MESGSILTRQDYEDYMVRLYFGKGSNWLTICIDRAYLDFNRTLHGIACLPESLQQRLRQQATDEVLRALSDLRQRTDITSQTQFDDWHRAVCYGLPELYREGGFATFRIGQAQKWVNMSLKYIFVLGEQRLAGFRRFYPLCHVPLDNYIIEALAPYDFPKLTKPWSRIDDYREYLCLQQWIRNRFVVCAMDVEFRLWMEQPVDGREGH